MRLDEADALYLDGPVDRAYLGSNLVWRALITVTPEAPIFHDGEPWVTLPEQEGVTYTVQGTPGAGESVTVTATAQDGYQLAGVTEWGHEWPSPYPMSGEWTGALDWNNTTAVTHAIEETGTYLIEWTMSAQGGALRAQIRTPAGQVEGDVAWFGAASEVSTTETLTVGAVIEFAYRIELDSSDATGTWTITPA